MRDMHVHKEIEFHSILKDVSMADEWYSMVATDHFWIERRSKVLHTLVSGFMEQGQSYVDVGCGSGIFQRMLADEYGVAVDGFDLNLKALEANISGQRLYYYDIRDQSPRFQHAYAGAFALDVLEHVSEEEEFIRALLGLIRPSGFICINVPALQSLYSEYDRQAGHLRRYVIDDFRRLEKRIGFRIIRWSYWGLPLLPLLFIRKVVARYWNPQSVIQRGFKPGNALVNRALGTIAKLEVIPQHCVGTSLMLVIQVS